MPKLKIFKYYFSELYDGREFGNSNFVVAKNAREAQKIAKKAIIADTWDGYDEKEYPRWKKIQGVSNRIPAPSGETIIQFDFLHEITEEWVAAPNGNTQKILLTVG